MSIDFLLTSLIVVVSPGTGVLFTLAAALTRGFRASVVAAFGCTLGIVPHMAAAILGVSALLQTAALAFEVIKVLGVAYLLYLAWSSLREVGALNISEVSPESAGRVIVRAILINVLNPKLSLFFFAFLPQFVRADDPDATARLVLLSAVFMIMTFVVFVLYGLFAAAVRTQVVSRVGVLTWIRRTVAAAFVLLAAKLAFTER